MILNNQLTNKNVNNSNLSRYSNLSYNNVEKIKKTLWPISNS